MKIVLVSFLPDDHGYRCEVHPYRCGNTFIEKEDSGVCSLVCLQSVEKTHLAGHEVQDDRSDGCRVCFVAREYTIGGNVHVLDGTVLRVTKCQKIQIKYNIIFQTKLVTLT